MVQYRAAIYWSIFVQVAHRIANAKIIDDKSYLVSFLIFGFSVNKFIYFCLKHSMFSTSALAQDI